MDFKEQQHRRSVQREWDRSTREVYGLVGVLAAIALSTAAAIWVGRGALDAQSTPKAKQCASDDPSKLNPAPLKHCG